jgi:hypothetical protein
MPKSGVAVSRGDRSGREDRPTASGFARESHDVQPPLRETARIYSRPNAAGRLPDAGGVPGRPTVTIRGQGAERYAPRSARRPAERRHERAGFRPDRAAMWAVLLGLMLILAAVTSAHAATLHALTRLH